MPTSLGPAEIMVILVVALIVLGPKRLPEAGRQVGKAIAEVRKWSQGFQDEIRGVVNPDNSPPSYAQPQPGYDPPPIPIVPAETAPPAEADASPPPAGTNGSAPAESAWVHSWPTEPAQAEWHGDAPPAEVEAHADPAPRPAGEPTDPEPSDPSGPPAGESPQA